ncbi:hypothetical protein [Neisseria zalophi]|nr:hypothetical protein [Neisseria zalophi]
MNFYIQVLIYIFCNCFLIACTPSNKQQKNIEINTNTFFEINPIDTDIKYGSVIISNELTSPIFLMTIGEKAFKNKKIELVKTKFQLNEKNKFTLINEPCNKLCKLNFEVMAFDSNKKLKIFGTNEIFNENGEVLLKKNGIIKPVFNKQSEAIGILNYSNLDYDNPNTIYTVTYQNLSGETIKTLEQCGNEGVNTSFQFGSYWSNNKINFFSINFEEKLLCIEAINKKIRKVKWPFSRISFTNAFEENFLILQPIKSENAVQIILVNKETLLPKKLFKYSKPDIFKLISDTNNFSNATSFKGCDDYDYFAVNLQGGVDYPFSRVLIFNKQGHIIFDMKSNRIHDLYYINHLHKILLIGNDGVFLLEDKRC